jgi:hypothetical protein
MSKLPELASLDVERLAILINCVSAIGSQLLAKRPDLRQTAYDNLQKFKRTDKDLLENVHSMALKAGSVSVLRLSEDLERPPTDAMQAIGLAHNCLLATVFLSFCIASQKSASLPASDVANERRLH